MVHRPSVVIVGGGPAGAATAMTLCRRGIQPLLVERASGPQAKAGETLGSNLVSLLKKLDIWEDLDHKIRLPSYGNAFIWSENTVREQHSILDTRGEGIHLNRQAFEALLAQKAQDAGTLWHWETQFEKAVFEKGVWKVELLRGGKREEIEADFLVDGSGRSARVARLAGGVKIRKLFPLFAAFARVPAEREAPHQTFVEAVHDGWWYLAQVPEQQQVLAFFSSAEKLRQLQKHSSLLAHLAQTSLISRVYSGPQDPEFRVKEAGTQTLEQITGEGWLAVGDAACAYDPISSYGMGSGLGGGFYAGNAISDHLQGRPEALAAYRKVMAKSFVTCVEMIRQQYRKEQRFPDAAFWRQWQ